MRYWVQYHNFEKVNDFPADECGITTDKDEVLEAVGDTIFLIVGVGESPKQYLLWEQFVCEEVFDGGEPPWRYDAFGSGWFLEQNRGSRTLLNRRPGFYDYLSWAQNFRIGFHEITEHPFLETLLMISKQCKPRQPVKLESPVEDDIRDPEVEPAEAKSARVIVTPPPPADDVNDLSTDPAPSSNDIDVAAKESTDHATESTQEHTDDGAGFGSASTNQEVEQAAVRFVTAHLQAEGWEVESVERHKCGYDLVCLRDSELLQVEVKGISGVGKQFIISLNEVREAQKQEPEYRLAVVNQALSKEPILSLYTAQEFLEAFNLKVINYMATLKATA